MPLLHNIGVKDYQDLRVTVVMNGGVSLAVWIGGVTHEIHRLQEGDDAYAQLADFTASRARVDLISGTSAGGINGAFLAVARVFGADLTPLRNVWLQSASFDELLRDPKAKDSSSLLRGTYFHDELLKAFQRLTGLTARPAEDASIELILTTTLLHGLPNRLADDFGTPINDANHRGSFHFRRGPDVSPDDFADPLLAEQLAVAARATASFPVAFEPVFCRRVPDAGEIAPRLDSVASFQTDRYLLDGGILDNKPLDHALQALARLRFKGEVRRVILYVVPSPGKTASSQPDVVDTPPTITEVAIASTSTLPMGQSISAQIDQIADHNRNVREVRQTRLALASLEWQSVQSSAASLFEPYQHRRADSVAVYITEQVVRAIVRDDSRQAIGRRRRDWIASLFLVIFRQQGLPWVPKSLPPENAQHAQLDLDNWHWGLFTVENIASTALDVLHGGIHLTALNASDQQSAELTASSELQKIRASADTLLFRLFSMRDADGSFWKQRADVFPEPLGDHTAAQRWAVESMQTYPNSAECGSIAFSFAELLAAAAPHLRVLASSALTRHRWTAETDAASELQRIIDLLVPHGLGPAGILVRLLTLEVVQFAVGFSERARNVVDQVLELVEICTDNSAFLGLSAVRGRKPAGAGLANFGGFYKKSWRANDWMLGRLHGAERLVLILLDPERIRRLYFGQDPSVVCQQLEMIAIPPPGDPDEQGCRKWWNQRIDHVAKELAFLRNPDQPLPEQLVHAAHAVLYRFQLAILREELPLLASAIDDDIQDRHGPGKGRDFLNLVRGITADQGYTALRNVRSDVIENLYASCNVDQETISEQSTSDRFTATITRAVAVGVSMLAGKNVGVPRVGSLVRVLRFPAVLTDAIAQGLLQESRVGVFAYAAIIGASVAILLLTLSPTAHIPWLYVLGAAAALALSVGLFAGHGKHRLKLLVLLFVILIYLASPEIRHVLSKTWAWVRGQVP